MRCKRRLNTDQTGLVSFFVVGIILIIITLLVLAFSRVVNREQRQTLDRQLNSQALYAAESGINDAIVALESNSDLAGSYEDNCQGTGSFINEAGLNPNIDGSDNIVYTCVFVDRTPGVLDFRLDPGLSQVAVIRPEGDGGVRSLNFTWRSTGGYDGRAQVSGCASGGGGPNLLDKPPTPYSNCHFAHMRLEFVRMNGATSRDQLIDGNRAIFFAVPTTGMAGQANLSAAQSTNQGAVVSARCHSNDADQFCTLNINNMGDFIGYVRLTPMYYASRIIVSGTRQAAGAGVAQFAGSQVAIDVTGRASDVLKRVRLQTTLRSASLDGPIPGYALQSRRTQCKNFSIASGSISLPASSPPECDPTP